VERLTIISVGMGLSVLVSLALVAEAQHEHGDPMKEETLTVGLQDSRVPLGLREGAEAGLKLTMREHLEAIHDIVTALSRQDFENAAKVAQDELGFSKHHEAMKREAGGDFSFEVSRTRDGAPSGGGGLSQGGAFQRFQDNLAPA
jgi:hypothetical protein